MKKTLYTEEDVERGIEAFYDRNDLGVPMSDLIEAVLDAVLPDYLRRLADDWQMATRMGRRIEPADKWLRRRAEEE